MRCPQAEPQSAASFFPPRKIVKGNSLYERLVAAGKKSPIIMAGVNDDVLFKPSAGLTASPAARQLSAGRAEPSVGGLLASARAEPRVSSGVDLSAGQLPAVDPDRLRVDTGVIAVQVSDAQARGVTQLQAKTEGMRYSGPARQGWWGGLVEGGCR